MRLFFIIPPGSCAEALWSVIPGRKLWTDIIAIVPDEEIDVVLCRNYGWHAKFSGEYQYLLVTDSAIARLTRAWGEVGSYQAFVYGHPEQCNVLTQVLGHGNLQDAQANLKKIKTCITVPQLRVARVWDMICKRHGWGKIELPKFVDGPSPKLLHADMLYTGMQNQEDAVLYTQITGMGNRLLEERS